MRKTWSTVNAINLNYSLNKSYIKQWFVEKFIHDWLTDFFITTTVVRKTAQFEFFPLKLLKHRYNSAFSVFSNLDTKLLKTQQHHDTIPQYL